MLENRLDIYHITEPFLYGSGTDEIKVIKISTWRDPEYLLYGKVPTDEIKVRGVHILYGKVPALTRSKLSKISTWQDPEYCLVRY